MSQPVPALARVMQCLNRQLYAEGLRLLQSSKTSPAAIDWGHKDVLKALTSQPHAWAEYVAGNTTVPERRAIRAQLSKAEWTARVLYTSCYVIRVPAALGTLSCVGALVLGDFQYMLEGDVTFLKGLLGAGVFMEVNRGVAYWRAERAACEFVRGYIDDSELLM